MLSWRKQNHQQLFETAVIEDAKRGVSCDFKPKPFMKWHPGDLTLGNFDIFFLQNMRNCCPVRWVKNMRRRCAPPFYRYLEKNRGRGCSPPAGRGLTYSLGLA